jgi:3-methyladenine DNA glycosylase AlkD
MKTLEALQIELNSYASKDRADFLQKFFKTNKDDYGENDKFIGVTVPDIRKIAKKYYLNLTLTELKELLHNPIHEYRLTALIILVYKFEKLKSEKDKYEIVTFYLDNIEFINNWDLVDITAHKILGAFFLDKDKTILYQLARSNNLWQKRIAIVSTFYFIKKNQFDDTLKLAEILLSDKHHLIHKAVGWMLREIGKINLSVQIEFLKKHYKNMPRTTLRYAIEKFNENLRKRFLSNKV